MDVYQRRRLVALSAVVGVFVVVVLAVASGGDDGATEVSAVTGATGQQGPPTLGKRAYIQRADRICAEANASLQTIDGIDLEQAAQTESRVITDQLQRLRALPPPERDRNLANAYLRALRTQVDALRDRGLALERDDDAALVEIDAALASAEERAQAAAAELGLELCSDPAASGASDDELDVPVEPAPVEPAPTEPATPVEPAPVDPAPAAPDDGGTVDPDTGGVVPDGGSSGGVSP